MTDSADPARYLLSHQEAERIFTSEIVPSGLLAGGSPQRSPVAVFMLGQPGSGKSTTMRSVMEHLAPRGGAVELSGDPFKPFHPQWKEFMARNDTLAGAMTAADGRRWRTMAQTYLMARRIDLVIETAGRNAAEFDDLAQRAQTAGYRVETVFLAVPAPVSRLGILDRFNDMRKTYGRGRMVTPEMHDSSYLGTQDVAGRIDTGAAAVGAVHILRRGNHMVYSNERATTGTWTHPPGAGQTLTAERAGWTTAEAQQFTAALERLRGDPGMEPWLEELQLFSAQAARLTMRGSEPGQSLGYVAAARLAGRAFPRPSQAAQQAPQVPQRPPQPPTPNQGRKLGR